jgi:hypothetical protein
MPEMKAYASTFGVVGLFVACSAKVAGWKVRVCCAARTGMGRTGVTAGQH